MTETPGIEATPDDAARAEAERLYPHPPRARSGADDRDYAAWGHAARAVERERVAYTRGRADERARIAARRDEVARAIDPDAFREDENLGARVLLRRRQLLALNKADAVLAAMGVSDR